MARNQSSASSIFFGVILFIAAFPLMFWNEWRAVNEMRTIEEGRKHVVSVLSDKIDRKNYGALVHLSGKVTTKKSLKDPVFKIKEKVLKLERKVEMYQWKEKVERRTIPGTDRKEKIYSYQKVWSDKLIDANNFDNVSSERRNPKTLPYDNKTFTAPNIKIGAFTLSKVFKDEIDAYQAYPLEKKHYRALPRKMRKNFRLEGKFFIRGSKEPEVGDIRVSYRVIKPYAVSVIGMQGESTLETYHTKTGNEIALLDAGKVTAGTMFDREEEGNQLITWGLRIGAALIMWWGIYLLFTPLINVLDFIPVVGNIIAYSIGAVTGLIAVLLSGLVIVVAWGLVRPMMIIPVLGGLLFLIGVIIYKRKSGNSDTSSVRGNFQRRPERRGNKMGWNPDDYR